MEVHSRHLIAGTAVLVVLGTVTPARGQSGVSAPAEPAVVTLGEGLVQVVPDRAFVTIAVESRAANPREAQRLNAAAMTAVQQRVRALGIAADAIRTSGYDLQLEVDFVNGKRVIRGYVARNALEVRVDAVERLGEIVDAAVMSGATNVSGIRFDLKDRAAREREALRLAVADARARAEAMATGAGRTLDRIVRIEEHGVAPPPPMPMMRAAVAEAPAETTPVAAGTIEIRAQVTLTATLH